MILAAFCAAFLACFCVGYIVRGWVEGERHRGVPEHPSILRPPRQLRVIEGGIPRPFDQDKELRAE